MVTGARPFRLEDIRLPDEAEVPVNPSGQAIGSALRSDMYRPSMRAPTPVSQQGRAPVRSNLFPSGQAKGGVMQSELHRQPMQQSYAPQPSRTVVVRQEAALMFDGGKAAAAARETAAQEAARAAARQAAAFEAARKAEIVAAQEAERRAVLVQPRPSGQVAPATDLTPHQMLVRSDLVSYFALGGVILGVGLGIFTSSK